MINIRQFPSKVANGQVNFRGYFACPIRELYIQPNSEVKVVDFAKELKQIGNQAGFDVFIQTKNGIYNNHDHLLTPKAKGKTRFLPEFPTTWAQDDKIFIFSKGIEKLIGLCNEKIGDTFAGVALSKHLNVDFKVSQTGLEGGNVFIGKDNYGKRFAIVGLNALKTTSNLCTPYLLKSKEAEIQKIAKNLKINPKNVFVISQPDFHIDMAIRPLKYPDILVNDFDLTFSLLANLKKNESINKSINTIENLQCDTTETKKTLDYFQLYARPDTTVKELKEAGFNPIRVPGIFGGEKTLSNFMNAIVHQKEDGNLVYITNSSDISLFDGLTLNDIFKTELQKIFPNIQVEFISGPFDSKENQNAISFSLRELNGGIHCITVERPDFEKW